MKYNIPTKQSGYLPEVISILNSIDDTNLYNEEKSLNHPADLFLLVFSDVIESAHRLANRLNIETQKTKLSAVPPSSVHEFKLDIFNLIFYTSNFIEACQSIIKSLFKEGDKNFTKAVREFNENTKSYRDHTSKIINSIKHKHRRICPFSYSWNNNLIIGYYIEGMVSSDCIGPDITIHPMYAGVHTGFSLNYEIPFHISNIYFTSACLASVVNKYAKIKKSKMPEILKCEIIECLNEIEKINLFLLPNEFTKKLPAITKKPLNH